MNLNLRKFLFHMFIPAVLTVMLLPITVFAQENARTVSIPVSVGVTGKNIPSDMIYSLELEAVTPGAPMPAVTSVTLKNGEPGSFGPITYAVPDDYQYRIRQNMAEQNYFTFDKTVYQVTVRVVTNGDGQLSAELWAVSDQSQTAKLGNVRFNNTYARSSGGGGGGSGGGGGGGGGGSDGLTVIREGSAPLANLLSTIPEQLVPLTGLLPKTGDATHLLLWAALMVIFGSGFVILMVYRKRLD